MHDHRPSTTMSLNEKSRLNEIFCEVSIVLSFSENGSFSDSFTPFSDVSFRGNTNCVPEIHIDNHDTLALPVERL